MKDYLKSHIPEFMQESEELDGFLDAAGDFLDDAKEAIESFDDSHDHQKTSIFGLSNSLLDRGMNIPRGLDENVLRTILRDIPEVLMKVGTTDSLVVALRIVGLSPEVNEGWLPSPRNVRLGKYVDPESGEVSNFEINRYVYTKMLYGGVVVNDDGVFFEGYRYQDTFKNNKLGPFPILGERYDIVPAATVAVSKTPYTIVKIDDLDFNVETESYTDPETGETYEFSSSEEFKVINDILSYFLFGENRPTNQRVIVITALQPIEDEISVEEEYVDEHEYVPDGGDDLEDSTLLSDFDEINAGYGGNEVVVGDEFLVGTFSPHLSPFSVFGLLVVGDEIQAFEELDYIEGLSFTQTYGAGFDGVFLLTASSTVEIIAPVDSDLDIYVRDYTSDDGFVYLDSVSAAGVFNLNNEAQYHAFVVVFDNLSSPELFTINIEYNEYTFF